MTPITGVANYKYSEGILSKCTQQESLANIFTSTVAAFGVTDRRLKCYSTVNTGT